MAQVAGVSRTTASYVLAGRQDMRISAEAAARVREATAALGYRPNLTARSLRTSVTGTIGLLSDTIATDSFAGQFVSGATRAARQQGRLVVVGETEGDPAVEELLVREMLDREVDGVVYATMYTRQVRLPELLAATPVVLLNCLTEQPGFVSVVPDEFGAGRAAAQSLLDAGHRRGIHVVGEVPPHLYAADRRVAGVLAALRDAGTEPAGLLSCPWWPGPAYTAVAGLLASGVVPSALLCLTDRVAFGSYQALQEAGLRVPADVSVVSFDGSDLASWLRPALTTVALPHYAMGVAAVEQLAAPDAGAGQVRRVPMPLLERQSVGPPAVTVSAARLPRSRPGGTR